MKQTKYRFDEEGHLHTYDGEPLTGTSSVASVLAKPLTWWASGLAVKEFGCPDPKVLTKIKNKKATPEEVKAHYASIGLKLEYIKGMDMMEFAGLIDRAYRAHQTSLTDKAEEGTDLHAELERFVNDEMKGEQRLPEAYDKKIAPFITWARANIKDYLWSEGHCFSIKHKLGGISDLGFRDKEGKLAIMDFKSSKEAYLSQFWQCAGYDIQIFENGIVDKDGNEIVAAGLRFDYLAVLPFGMERPEPQFNYDLPGGREAFLAEVLLYKKLPRE